MQPEQVIAVLLVLAAVFSYVNERFLGISPTIGMLLLSLFVAVPIMVAGYLGWTTGQQEVLSFLESLDFRRTLMYALLLSLPASPERELLFDMTYAVVVFSLIVQGLTISRLFTSSQLKQIAELKS